jgi:hypothetical protein
MLTLRSSLNMTNKYDRIGCLSDINRVARHHNSLLRAAIGALRVKYPHATVIFADFYNPIMSILQNPNHFGNSLSRFALRTFIATFTLTIVLKYILQFAGVSHANALRACCGGGGNYNWNASAVCGMPGVPTCMDPSAFINWDGVHFTEATYQYIANGWLYGPFADPPILNAIRH